MSRIKFIITLFFSLPIAAFIAALFILDNPDTYRDTLAKSFHDETDLNLSISGDITWQYWPPIAIDISGISISPDNGDTPLATLESASIDIQVLPLLTSGRVLIKEIHIDGLNINAIVNKEGKGNWEQKGTKAEATLPSGNATQNNASQNNAPQDNNLDLDISEFAINDAKITYQDLRDETHYILDVTKFTTNTLKPEYPADINLLMTVEDKQAEIKVDTDMKGTLSFNQAFDQFKMTQLSVKNKIAQKGSPIIHSELILNGSINTTKGTTSLDKGTLALADMTMSFSLNANNIFQAPDIKGKISISEFNARSLFETFDVPLSKMQHPEALSKLGLSTNFKGTTHQIVFENLQATLDESNIDGRVVATIAPRLSAEFALHMDHINLSDYMEAEEENNSPPENKKTTINTDSEVIPISLLNEIQLNGSFDIDSLTYDSYQFDKMSISAINQQEGFRFNAAMAGYGGEFALQSQVRNFDPESEPRGKTTLIIKDVDISLLTELEAITGTLAMDSTTTFTGNMLSEVLSSLDGNSNFTVSNGTLNVEAIKGIASLVDSLQGKTSSISTWPDQLPFKKLEGKHQFDEGTIEGQQFSFVMENMEVIGTGGLDYFSNTLNYRIEATLKENVGGQFTVSKNLAGIRWPLHCAGSLDATASELCLANKDAVTNIVAEIAKQAIRREGEDKLLEKVPDEYKDAAKQLLKGLFN